MEIPNNVYLALQRMTEDDCSRLKADMTKEDVILMEECQEQTGKHRSDYDMTHKFESFQTIAQKKSKVVVSYHKTGLDAEKEQDNYLKGIAKITNRDFGISTSITRL